MIQYSSRVARDLRKLDPEQREHVRHALERMDAGAEGLNVKAMTGHPGWLRLRAGDYRILYRAVAGGWDVYRVVRRDLAQAASTLR